MKLDLLSNVSTVETAMKFISDYKNNNRELVQKRIVQNPENFTSKLPNYIIEETTTATTTNKVF
jgi:hypothetical protein